MTLYALPAHYGSTVDIDVCMDCNAIWFDQYESMQLAPDGTVALFQLIHERGGTATGASHKFSEGLRCITCGTSMALTHDQVKGTRFSYQACRKGHGRFTTFYNFLAEKQFVRELTKGERATLSATVAQVRCSGCGAAVDISKGDACEYCRAPLSVLDRDAAKKAIDHYLQERQKQPQAITGNSEAIRNNARLPWSSSDHAGLGADIVFALGRAATRGIGGMGRSAPVAGDRASGLSATFVGEGMVDLVSDGIGSLLGSFFD